VACGGNAEALARLAPGTPVAGFDTLSLRRLEDRLWEILRLNVEERMEAFGVRRDRAEVMGVAAVVFTSLGQWLGARQLLVPGVGVREGILHDLAAAHFGPATAHDERAESIRHQARRFAAHMHSDPPHCEQVRRLAAQLFDQLAPVHELPSGQRVPLELAALMHAVGYAVNAKGYHKHGEYLIRNADIPGLSRHQQDMIACLVRYQGEASPKPHHRVYRSLMPGERERVRQLASLLRIALALDASGTQVVRRIEAKLQRKSVLLRVAVPPEVHLDLKALRRSARLLEHEFGVRVRFVKLRMEKNRRPASIASERPGKITGMRRSPAPLRRRPAA
jgi:exopolyphosphatase/guanosine-5'-triphosphate,3'-diphosphate pyrophosphatase